MSGNEKNPTRTRRWRWLGSIGLVLVAIWLVPKLRSDRSHIESWLSDAGLAPLPADATNFAYYLWKGIFTASEYVMFQLPTNRINHWIEISPALQEARMESFDKEHQHLPAAGEDTKDTRHSYYFLPAKRPPWFAPTINGKGKKFQLHYGPNTLIFVNEETGIVFIQFGT